MSTYGSRKRNLLWIDVNVSRSFEDDAGPSVEKQVNEPTLAVTFNRFSVQITRRRSRWFLDRTFGMAGTPWFWAEWMLEEKTDKGPDYIYGGDWYPDQHDGMVE